MGDFEPFSGKGFGHTHDREPTFTVSERYLRMNRPLREAFFDDVERAEFLLDQEDSRLGVRPVGESETVPNAYSITDNGARVKVERVWEEMGVSIDETDHVVADVEGEDFPVMDVSAFVDSNADSAESDVEASSKPVSDPEPEPEPESTPDSETDSSPAKAAAVHLDRGNRTEGGSDPDDESDRDSEVEAEPESESEVTDGPLAIQVEQSIGIGKLADAKQVGLDAIRTVSEHGYGTLEKIRDTEVSELAEIEGIGTATASRMTDKATDVLEERAADAVLDHERVSTAMDSLGIDPKITSEGFVSAVDEHSQSYEVAQALDIARADAADLIRRLKLEDALHSEDGLAMERFENGEDGENA